MRKSVRKQRIGAPAELAGEPELITGYSALIWALGRRGPCVCLYYFNLLHKIWEWRLDTAWRRSRKLIGESGQTASRPIFSGLRGFRVLANQVYNEILLPFTLCIGGISEHALLRSLDWNEDKLLWIWPQRRRILNMFSSRLYLSIDKCSISFP